jgi:hypothetical protein
MTIVDHSPEAMTTRARVYLAACGFRHALLGIFVIGTPWLFSAALFVPIFNLLPLIAWGAIMFVCGFLCTTAWITRRADWARAGMVISASITLVLAAGLTIGLVSVWTDWVQAVGWGTVRTLFAGHDDTYPARLLSVASAPPSPFLALVMIAVTVKDFAVCAQPMRVPLEESITRRRLKQA